MKAAKRRLKYEIEKLSPMPGEIVLIRVQPGSLTAEEFGELKRNVEQLAQALKRLILIVLPNFDFATMGEAEMLRYGWQRIPPQPRPALTASDRTEPVPAL